MTLLSVGLQPLLVTRPTWRPPAPNTGTAARETLGETDGGRPWAG